MKCMSSSSEEPLTPKDLRYAPMTADLLEDAATLTADAFMSSPSYAYIYPDHERRRFFLKWMFERNFGLRLQSDACRCAFVGDELVGVFMFVGLRVVLSFFLGRACRPREHGLAEKVPPSGTSRVIRRKGPSTRLRPRAFARRSPRASRRSNRTCPT